MSGQEEKVNKNEKSIVPGRYQEKTLLQDLNQRYANYVQHIRLRRNGEANKGTTDMDERKWSNQLEQQRSFYEQQIADLRHQLEAAIADRNEMEANRIKYQSMSSEYDERFLSLNNTILQQADEISKLHVEISNKELELQQAKNQLTGPRTELDICKVERDDYKRRLAEAERRCQAEVKAKLEFQQQLTDFHARCSQEMRMYQTEVNDLQERLEKSQLVNLELEESSRRGGQRDSDVAEMMRKAREASEMELRRYMEETEAKHKLDISEIKMRTEAERSTVAALMEENGKLQMELNSTKTNLQLVQSQLSSMESTHKVALSSLESERKHFEAQMRKMERKLQETQDLLLIKMQELTAALDANIPLKVEIDMLRTLIEEEEKRLGIDTASLEKTMKNLNQSSVTGQQNFEFTANENQRSPERNEVSNTQTIGQNGIPSLASTTSPTAVSTGDQGIYTHVTRPRSSLPLTTQAFTRGANGADAMDLFTPPPFNPSRSNGFESKASKPYRSSSANDAGNDDFSGNDDDDDDDDAEITVNEMIASGRNSRCSANGGLQQLPPRPERPTPPKKLPLRPDSAVGCRYIPADAGQGRDYFDAMFNDLRKDTLYTKVTEESTGTDVSNLMPSTKRDLMNSTSSHDVKSSKSGKLWYTGTTASATGSMKIVDVDESGRYVRVHNTSCATVEDIGGYLLQQNVAGHPVAVFRFPPRTKLPQGHTATVWGAGCKEGIHDPPSHYVWKQLDKWGTGPECTTILCRPNGQAVAWMTSAPRVSRISRAYNYQSDESSQAAEVARLMKELHAQQTIYGKQVDKHNLANWENSRKDFEDTEMKMPYPTAYSEKPTVFSDSSPTPEPTSILKREKMLPSSSRLLPTRTGSSPLRKYVAPPKPLHHNSNPLAYQQRMATNGEAELIDLTTQRSARSKYGFDYMTHTPKVTSYDGTVRDR